MRVVDRNWVEEQVKVVDHNWVGELELELEQGEGHN